MVSKREKYIIKDNLRRSQRLKYLYVNHVRKSFYRNLFLEKHRRHYQSIALRKNLNNTNIKNICMLSGENTAVRKYFLASRFKLNHLSVQNNLQSFRLNS
jgi:hypothetical protein